MKRTKALTGMLALAFLAGCAGQQEEVTGADGQSGGSCCKADASKASCCDGTKTEATKAQEKPAEKN